MATRPGGPTDAVDGTLSGVAHADHPSVDPTAHPSVPAPSPDHDAPGGGLTVAPTRPRPGLVLIRVIGEIDMLTARRLGDVLQAGLRDAADDRAAEAAAADTAPTVVCDLGGVTFLGASGLDAFAAAQEEARARGVRLVVVAAHRTVRHPFRLTALDRGIQLTDTHPTLGREPRTPGW